MKMQAAITADLISSIVARCGISQERARAELKAASTAAKKTGLSLAETLQLLGLV